MLIPLGEGTADVADGKQDEGTQAAVSMHSDHESGKGGNGEGGESSPRTPADTERGKAPEDGEGGTENPGKHRRYSRLEEESPSPEPEKDQVQGKGMDSPTFDSINGSAKTGQYPKVEVATIVPATEMGPRGSTSNVRGKEAEEQAEETKPLWFCKMIVTYPKSAFGESSVIFWLLGLRCIHERTATL